MGTDLGHDLGYNLGHDLGNGLKNCKGTWESYHWSLHVIVDVVDEVPSAGNCPADMPL